MGEVKIELFPAMGGDCILITFEEIDYRILIDGGYKETFFHSLAATLKELSANGKGIDLVVVTHVDNDHIMGIIGLFQKLKSQEINIEVREIWYNGYRHLFADKKKALSPAFGKKLLDEVGKIESFGMEARQGKEIGYSQGETLAKLLAEDWENIWNGKFGGKAVCCQAERGAVGLFPKRLSAALLNPGCLELQALERQWNAFRRKKCLPLENGDSAVYEHCFELYLANADSSVTNQSSIAFLLTYVAKEKTYQLLFLGDASAKRCLERLGDWEKFKFDCIKLPHHGSKKNITEDTLSQLQAEYLLVSTDGRKFGHPDWEVIEAAIHAEHCNRLVFNYGCNATECIREKYPDVAVLAGQGGYFKLEL